MLVVRSCLTLCDPMDCSPPGSSVHGILQARIPEWVAMPSSRGSSGPRDRTCVSCVSCSSRPFIRWCGLNETLHTLPGPEQGLKTSCLDLLCASEAEKTQQSINTSLDNEDHLSNGASDRQSSGGQDEGQRASGQGQWPEQKTKIRKRLGMFQEPPVDEFGRGRQFSWGKNGRQD